MIPADIITNGVMFKNNFVDIKSYERECWGKCSGRKGENMNNSIFSSNMTRIYNTLWNGYGAKSSQKETVDFLDEVSEKIETDQVKRESVVDQYKKNHPERAFTVDSQVEAGKAFKRKMGVENVSTDDMTMAEYKEFITWLLNSIPFDSTRLYDKEITSISDEGWEQMKNDPDYEAWVLGYTVQNRSVRNPFFGLSGKTGTFYVEKFGASIEEHIGQSIGTTGPVVNTPKVKKEESWWDKRQKIMKEHLEEEIEKEQEKAQAQRALAQENYYNELYGGQQRLRGFLMQGVLGDQEAKRMTTSRPTELSSLAAAAYEDTLLIFSKRIMGGKK